MSGDIYTTCVITDDLEPVQERQISAVFKRAAENWWHQVPNVWFVVSWRKPTQWYEELKNIILPGGLILVHEVKSAPTKHPTVVYRGPGEAVEWFKQELSADDIVPF